MKPRDEARSINERVQLGVKYSSAEFVALLKAAGVKYPAPFSRVLCRVCSYVTITSIGPKNVIIRTGAITEEVVKRVMAEVRSSIKSQGMDEQKAIDFLKSKGYIIYKLV